MDVFSTTQGAQKVRSRLYRLEGFIITEDLILGTALGPRFFYSQSFMIWYLQYSTYDRIWQLLKSFRVRLQTSVESAGWKFQ